MEWQPVKVECYSGYTYAQEPRAVLWQGERLAVSDIISSFRAPEGLHFKVKLQNGAELQLVYDEGNDSWRACAGH
jgi:hypothetical protein